MKSRLICYYFGYTEEDLCQDVLLHGRSLIMERILAEKKTATAAALRQTPLATAVWVRSARWWTRF